VLFKAVGMALFDLFAAQRIFEAAKEKGIGQKIK
ncbi:MAG TPA: ornithine cyclodeaminase, partial [Clostridiaceae bacterium]|nr:ornithine cyclodeaminase [Clostridiaceae bacterium]